MSPKDEITLDTQFADTDEESEIEAGITQSYKTFDVGTMPSVSLTPEFFDEFKRTVFASRPTIEKVYTQHGATPFYNYAKSHVRENRNKIIRIRKAEFSATLYEQVRRVLGTAIADSVEKQLKTNDSISTVQKDAPVSYPDTLNATLMNALPYFGAQHPSFNNILVFACAGISFNNTKFPRGDLFHTFTDNTVFTNALTLFGHTVDARPVIFYPPYTPNGIIEAKNSLLQLKREGKLTNEVESKIVSLLDDVYGSPHALSANDYVDQLTISNYHIFKKMFKHYPKHTPSLIYLSQEKIALALILEHHIDTNTTIHRLLFDPVFHALIDTHFDGLTGAFLKEKKRGSYLFWGLPPHGKYRTQLWRKGNMLKSDDGSIQIELTPERIRQAILNKEIIPSILLTFVIIALYYGLILGGGYEQTFYLTKMKERYITLLNEAGDSESAEAAADLSTENLVIPRPLLTYIETKNDSRIPSTAIDMLLYGDQGKSWHAILEASKQVTLGEIIERTLPSIYREYSQNKPNAEKFTGLSERDVEKINGLDQKIPPLITQMN